MRISDWSSDVCSSDLGKALGIDPMIIDAVAKSHHYWSGRRNMGARMAECGLDPESPTAWQWVRLAERLLGFTRTLSQQPGGFVISRGPLCRLDPIQHGSMPGRRVVPWEREDLDVRGWVTVDTMAMERQRILHFE